MANFASIGAYIAFQNRRIRAIKKSGIRTGKMAAQFMVVTARKFAPKDSGATRRGIRKRRISKGWIAESRVKGNKGFKQNMWANKTDPFRRNSRLGVYGTRNYNYTARGVAKNQGFWNVALRQTRRFFNKGMRRNTRKALQGRF